MRRQKKWNEKTRRDLLGILWWIIERVSSVKTGVKENLDDRDRLIAADRQHSLIKWKIFPLHVTHLLLCFRQPHLEEFRDRRLKDLMVLFRCLNDSDSYGKRYWIRHRSTKPKGPSENGFVRTSNHLEIRTTKTENPYQWLYHFRHTVYTKNTVRDHKLRSGQYRRSIWSNMEYPTWPQITLLFST